MRLAIVGSRGFDNYGLFEETIEHLTNTFGFFQLVSGGAEGPDEWAETYVSSRPHSYPPPIIYEADWRPKGVYNKRAGLERNSQIVNDCEAVVAFWDGQSTGTRDTLRKAGRKGIPTLIVYPDGGMELA